MHTLISLRRTCTVALLLLTCSSIASATTLPPHPTSPKPATATTPAHSNPLIIYCPSISTIKKRGLFWYAPGSWRSYNQSFSKHLYHFLGVQWVGVNIGRVICLYRGNGSFTFPIALQKGELVLPPKQHEGQWVQDKRGYWRCMSKWRIDCPFSTTKKEAPVNIHELLDHIKQADPQQTTSGQPRVAS